MIWLRRVGFLIHKEILAILKEPANRVILFAPPLLQALLFGYAANTDVNNVSYALLDQSQSEASTQLITHLDGTGVFHRISTLTSSSQVSQAIDTDHALLVIVIPSDFASKLNHNSTAPVQVILDGRNSSTASAAANYVSTVVSRYNQDRGGHSDIPVLETRAWYNPNLDSQWGMMPSLIASLSMLQTLMLAALSVAREREQGTFDQLLVTPYTPMQLLLGKAIPSILIGLLQSTIILLIILYWFRIPMHGSLLLLYFGLLCFNIAAVGIGLSLSAVALNMQQAMLYTFLVMMPLMLLSGLLSPIETMPEILNIMTYANPLRFAIDLVRRVYLEGADFYDIAFNFIPMLVMAAITLPLAAWLFRNRLY